MMRLHSILAIAPLVALTALPAQAQMATLSPEQIGQIFCIASLGNDMAPAQALLSDDLSALIADAWERNAAFESAYPGDKPPLGDGLPWRSWPDYADGCAVTESMADGDLAEVTIDYSFGDYPDSNYSNVLLLRPYGINIGAPPVWRIDDIDLGEGNTMRTALEQAFLP